MSTLPKIKLQKWDKTSYSLQDFQGKNILIVNINPGVDKFKEELEDYRYLKQKYKENLVIILVPSIDFDTGFTNAVDVVDLSSIETQDGIIINDWARVTGTNKHDLYKWLTLVLEDHYYEEVHPKDVIESREVDNNFTKFFIHYTGINAFRFSSGHDIDYVEDVMDHLIKKDIIWNREVEIPKKYIEALWNIDNMEEPDPWDIDHSIKLKINM